MKRLFNFRLIPIILLGIVLAVCSIAFLDEALIIALFVGVLILLLCSVFVKQMKKARGKLIALLLAFCIMLGITQLSFDSIERNAIYSQNSIIEGRIDIITESDPQGMVDDEGKIEIYLEDLTIDGIKYEGKAETVFVDGSLLEGLRIGDRIKFRGDVSPMTLNVKDSYSVADYTDGIYYHIYADWDSAAEGFIFEYLGNDASITDKIKLSVKKALYANIKADTAGFLYAMTFGDKSGLDEEIKTAFSYTGTAHIFAVSGLHIGIIAGAVIFLLKKLRIKNSIAQFAIVGALLIPFCALCEFSPSTVRATIMILVFLASKIFMMRSDAMTNFSLAAVILLVIDPIYLFDLGFLMSFMAVFGLITLAKPIERCLVRIRCPQSLASLLSATLSANIALLPIMLLYFGGQSLIFIVANLIILPLLAVMFPIYLVIVFMTAIVSFTGFLLTATGWIFTVLIFVIKSLSGCNFLIVNFDINGVFIAIDIFVMLVLSKYIMIPSKAKTITASVLLGVFCIGIIGNLNIKLDGLTYLYCYTDSENCQYVILDDKQFGTYLIVNGEAGYDAADSLLDVMREKNVSRIDGVVIVDECDEEAVDEIMFASKCSALYSFSDNDYRALGYPVYDILFEDGFMIGFYNRGTLDIIIGETDIRVLANGYVLRDKQYDILVSYDAVGEQNDGQYAVCEEGYVNSLKNYVSSTFTIRIKDDKIKTSYLWS